MVLVTVKVDTRDIVMTVVSDMEVREAELTKTSSPSVGSGSDKPEVASPLDAAVIELVVTLDAELMMVVASLVVESPGGVVGPAVSVLLGGSESSASSVCRVNPVL